MTISLLVGVPSAVDLDSLEGRRLVTEMLQDGRVQPVPWITDGELMKQVESVDIGQLVRKRT
jgi:hypothetical protein